MDATERGHEEDDHPEPVAEDRRAPEERGDFTEAERARIRVAGGLFDAEVAFAEHELHDLKDEEERGEQDQRGHGGNEEGPGAGWQPGARGAGGWWRRGGGGAGARGAERSADSEAGRFPMREEAGAGGADRLVRGVVVEPGGRDMHAARVIIVFGVAEEKMAEFVEAKGGDHVEAFVVGDAAVVVREAGGKAAARDAVDFWPDSG